VDTAFVGKMMNVWDVTGERKNGEIQKKVIKRIKSMSYDLLNDND